MPTTPGQVGTLEIELEQVKITHCLPEQTVRNLMDALERLRTYIHLMYDEAATENIPIMIPDDLQEIFEELQGALGLSDVDPEVAAVANGQCPSCQLKS